VGFGGVMTDIHSHILYNIDDGPETFSESIEMLEYYSFLGVEKVIATPHFILGKNETKKEDIFYKCGVLNDYSIKHNLGVYVYPGNEVMIHPEINKYINDEKICSLGGTNYILLELDNSYLPEITLEIFYNIIVDGYIPVLAHPERSIFSKSDIYLMEKLQNLGVLMQVDIKSLYSKNNSNRFKYTKKLLKNNLVNFVSSDAHKKSTKQKMFSSFLNGSGKNSMLEIDAKFEHELTQFNNVAQRIFA
jgi:protein-tyrosine phosphatase